jgi:hypothetical protein
MDEDAEEEGEQEETHGKPGEDTDDHGIGPARQRDRQRDG